MIRQYCQKFANRKLLRCDGTARIHDSLVRIIDETNGWRFCGSLMSIKLPITFFHYDFDIDFTGSTIAEFSD